MAHIDGDAMGCNGIHSQCNSFDIANFQLGPRVMDRSNTLRDGSNSGGMGYVIKKVIRGDGKPATSMVSHEGIPFLGIRRPCLMTWSLFSPVKTTNHFTKPGRIHTPWRIHELLGWDGHLQESCRASAAKSLTQRRWRLSPPGGCWSSWRPCISLWCRPGGWRSMIDYPKIYKIWEPKMKKSKPDFEGRISDRLGSLFLCRTWLSGSLHGGRMEQKIILRPLETCAFKPSRPHSKAMSRAIWSYGALPAMFLLVESNVLHA